MALCFSPTRTHQPQALPHARTANSTAPPRLFTNPYFPSTIHLHRSSSLFASNPNAWNSPCRAVSPGRPPPPESDPSTEEDPTLSAGPAEKFARLQDTAQIFFAVLFWMSLFFWASAWDGPNNGRPSKGSRFRR